MSDVTIAEHAFLSDCHSRPLVTRDGSVDWLCLPRFDSQPAHVRLLDDDAGHLLLPPADAAAVAVRRYLPQTQALETVRTARGGGRARRGRPARIARTATTRRTRKPSLWLEQTGVTIACIPTLPLDRVHVLGDYHPVDIRVAGLDGTGAPPGYRLLGSLAGSRGPGY